MTTSKKTTQTKDKHEPESHEDAESFETLFRRLRLANARRRWSDICDEAERENWTYHGFLRVILEEEVAHRRQTRLQKLTRDADFPFLKTIDDFNFEHQSTLRLNLVGSFLSPDFVTDGRCLVLSGKTGRGKTHLAVAIAYRAIQNGFTALFVTASALIDDLSAAAREGHLRERLLHYVSPSVLVIDEVGYLTYGTDAANVMFQVVNERHRKQRAMILTTNKHLKTWGKVLHDPDLAAAIVDRILERGRVIKMDGPSVRTLHIDLSDLRVDEDRMQATSETQ